jgi:hypothetical protein
MQFLVDQYKIDTLYKKQKVVQGKGTDQRSVPVGFSFGPSYTLTADFGIMKFAYGIAKYVNLQIYTPVYIRDVFVRPVVNEQNPGSSSLYLDAWIENCTDIRKDIILTCDLSKWEKNPDKWEYPDIPDQNVSLEAKSKIKVTIGPIPWKLGPKSFWWPNIPFEENYQAKLHRLTIALKDRNTVLGTKAIRFGFCTYSEGPYYYKINGKRFMSVGDGTPESGMSFYDCYTTAEAWTSGCSETLKRYMRLGFNTNRICQATATDHMMNIADEVGFMFIGETSIYGYENDYWFDNYGNHVKELARVYRNHPSTARYILSNEIPVEWTMLIDSIVTEDNTRPLTYETVNNPQFGKITSGQYHAFKMNHYFDLPKARDTTMLRGYGEIAWGGYDTKDSVAMLYFSNSVRKARILDLAYMAPWDLLNYWPNFLQGMNHNLHGWIANNHADRPDDPGRGGNLVSPDIIYMKRSLEPFAIFDKKYEFSKTKHDTLPGEIDRYTAGSNVLRTIEVFNGGIESRASDTMRLDWEARWDKDGPVIISGSTGKFSLTPGWHTEKAIRFKAPTPGSTERKLYLILKSYNNEQQVNIMTEYYFIISPHTINPNVSQ